MNRHAAGLALSLLALASQSACRRKPTTGLAGSDGGAKSVSSSANNKNIVVPPSTGSELVVPSGSMNRIDADAAIFAMIREAQNAKPDCAKLTSAATQNAITVVNPDAEFFKSNEPAIVAVARCAEREHAYYLMLKLANGLERAKPNDGGHPELVARALMGVGANDDADNVLVGLVAKRPKDPNVHLAMAKLRCRTDRYKECLESADQTYKIVSSSRDEESKSLSWRAQKFRARALLHAGKFAEASAAIDLALKSGAPASSVADVQKELVPAKATKVMTALEMSDQIPLGAYHLFGKVKSVGSVVDVKIFNLDTADHHMKIEAEIPGTTTRAVQTIAVLKGAFETVHLNPPLKADLNPGSIRAESPGQFSLKISRLDGAKETTVYDQSHPVTLLPRDSLSLTRYFDRDRSYSQKTPEFLGAWVTPNAKGIDEFLAVAKKRLAPGQSFSGGQSQTMPQVKALYDELRARGMSYVMDPSLFGQHTMMQRTRLPAEVIKSTNAQCLEGAIVYATLFEAIGLRPFIVWVPGHAFVGWHAESHDPNSGQLNFLETTLTHSAEFEKAVAYAKTEYDQHRARREFEPSPSGGAPASLLVEIASLRKAGVTPQPFE